MENKQAKAAAEAREILNRSAEVLEAEWQRMMRAFESSEMVPAPVKQQLTQAVNRLNAIVESTTPPSGRDVARELVEAAGEVRTFVTGLAGAMLRTAAEAGFPVPGAAPAPGATTPPPPPPAAEPVVGDPAAPPGPEPAAAEAPAPAETATTKKAAARKAVVKKQAVVKEAATKAAATRKAAVKKAATKASATKKAAVKKAATTAGATKKVAAKKAATTKAAAKKATPARKKAAPGS